MTQIDVHTLQAELTRYLDQVAAGQTIIVSKGGKAVAELRPILPPKIEPRPLGLGVGQGEILADFFESLPDDLAARFSGEKE